MCSLFSVSTARASGGDMGPGRAGPTEGKHKEVMGSPGVPLSQAPRSLGDLSHV